MRAHLPQFHPIRHRLLLHKAACQSEFRSGGIGIRAVFL